jgi:ankyrin repeat protein
MSSRRKRSGSSIILKLFLPFIVLPLVGFVLVMLPQWFPDNDVVAEAIRNGGIEQVRGLLDRGVDPNTRSATASTLNQWLLPFRSSGRGYAPDFGPREPLLIVALDSTQFAIARLLIERGSDPNARDDTGMTALAKAVFHGQRELVELLLARGADPRATMPDGSTALLEVSGRPRTNDPAIVELLTSAEKSPATR